MSNVIYKFSAKTVKNTRGVLNPLLGRRTSPRIQIPLSAPHTKHRNKFSMFFRYTKKRARRTPADPLFHKMHVRSRIPRAAVLLYRLFARSHRSQRIFMIKIQPVKHKSPRPRYTYNMTIMTATDTATDMINPTALTATAALPTPLSLSLR